MTAISSAIATMSNARQVSGRTVCFYAEAYARKEELGGGFRGKVVCGAKRVFETEVMANQAEAFRACYDHIMATAGGAGVGVGHYRGNRFRKNYFVSAD